MENIETLLGKYGEEGDKLIFKILNNGLDNRSKEKQIREDFEKVLQGKNSAVITARALKYDLTIPFARYVAMNHGQLTFPFKRYQIQPVWRADRPQKGRYREFYQCDADIVGSDSLLNEADFVNVYAEAFERLKIPVEIKINNRKILMALAAMSAGVDKMMEITMAIDKLDKIGLEKVKVELSQRGLDATHIAAIEKFLRISGTNAEKIASAKEMIGRIKTGKEGIEELESILSYPLTARRAALVIDFTLARGLNYYTGTIFEVKANNVQIGSIGGGGRYDDLTGLFGVPGVPGVGISFGVDRIYDVIEELKLFPGDVRMGTQVLLFNLGKREAKHAFELATHLRNHNVSCEVYHEPAKFDKQFKYAEKRSIPFVLIIGEEEMETGTYKLKKLSTGEQVELSREKIAGFVFANP